MWVYFFNVYLFFSHSKEPIRPLTAPALRMRKAPKMSETVILPLNLNTYTKWYTGNLIVGDPPMSTNSKRYFHLYSINTPRRSSSQVNFRNKDLDENYKRALQSIQEIAKNKSTCYFKNSVSIIIFYLKYR